MIRVFTNTVFWLINICLSFAFILNDVEANDSPKRIVSLGPSITEGIFLLGYGEKIIGVTNYCIKPHEAQKKDKVGGVTNINIEKISSLNPDIIFATSLTDIRAVEKLKTLGFSVITFPLAKNFDDINSHFITLGRIIGKHAEAERVVKDAKARLNRLKSKIVHVEKPKVFVQIGAKPLFTITRDSFVNNMIALSGGINIAQGAQTGVYSREKVIEQNPDVLFIMDMGIATEEEKALWLRYPAINAVKNKRIYTIDSYKFGSPTPITFVDTVEELINLLHRDKIKI